jgi:hypothetical protein
MRFELEPDNFNQPDEDLLADLRRVAALIQPAGITKDLYNEHGRWCAATMQKRFGNWNTALRRAGIQPTKLVSIPPEDVIEDIKAVAATLGTHVLSLSQYKTIGKYTYRPIYRNFGDWAGAVRAAGLTPRYELPVEVTDELCFEAIETAWQRLGRQPRQADVRKPESKIGEGAITRRFGSWRKALEAFVASVNKPDEPSAPEAQTGTGAAHGVGPSEEEAPKPRHATARTAGWKLRFLVMRRDGFRCVQCGRSPANEVGTILVIDHITPWSKGGDTVYGNLRTLCEVCNGGRNNLDLAEDAAK